MQDHVVEGRLLCVGRQWPVQVQFIDVVAIRIRHAPYPSLTDPIRPERYPPPSERNNIVYQGSVTVTREEPGQALPSESDLHGKAVLLLLDRLPRHGACPTGQWQLPIHVTRVDQPAGQESVRFDFMQHGGIGHPLK